MPRLTADAPQRQPARFSEQARRPFGLVTLASASSTPGGGVTTARNTFRVTAAGARLAAHWRGPGFPMPEGEPNALAALARDAERHARAVLSGEPTADNPTPRPSWRDRKAA